MSTSKCFGICIKNSKVFGFPNNDFMKNVDDGTLLEINYTKKGEGIIFSVYDDEMKIDDQIYCGLSEDFNIVKKQLWPFLVGIKNPVDRSQFIKNHELTDFILGIGINDQVWFKLEVNLSFMEGFVRYIALVPSIGHGLYFGIEVPEYKSKKSNSVEDFMHTIVVAANLIRQTEAPKLILLNDDPEVPMVSFNDFIEALNSNDEYTDQILNKTYSDSVQFLKENLHQPIENETEEEITCTDDVFYDHKYIKPISSRSNINVPSSTLVTTLTEDEYESNKRKHENSLKQAIVCEDWTDDTTQAAERVFYNHNYIEPTSSRPPFSTFVKPFPENEYEVNRRKHENSLRKPFVHDDLAGATALPDYWKHLFVKNPTVWICKNCTLENVMTSFVCAACDQPMIREKPDHLKEDGETPNGNSFLDEATFPYLDDDNDVVPNHNEFECPLCLKTCLPNDGVVLRDCIHSFCITCIRESIINNLSTQIKCPFKPDYVCESSLQDREIKGIVGQDIYDEYLARITLEIQKDKNIFNCRNGNCIGYGFVDEQQTAMECFECKIVNCILCRDIHDGMNCEEFKKFKIQQMEINDKKTEVTFTPHYFQCQICRQYTKGVYLDRCNHSACKICLIEQLTTSKSKNIQCPVQNCNEQVEECVRQQVLTEKQYERYLFRNKVKNNNCPIL